MNGDGNVESSMRIAQTVGRCGVKLTVASRLPSGHWNIRLQCLGKGALPQPELMPLTCWHTAVVGQDTDADVLISKFIGARHLGRFEYLQVVVFDLTDRIRFLLEVSRRGLSQEKRITSKDKVWVDASITDQCDMRDRHGKYDPRDHWEPTYMEQFSGKQVDNSLTWSQRVHGTGQLAKLRMVGKNRECQLKDDGEWPERCNPNEQTPVVSAEELHVLVQQAIESRESFRESADKLKARMLDGVQLSQLVPIGSSEYSNLRAKLHRLRSEIRQRLNRQYPDLVRCLRNRKEADSIDNRSSEESE